MLTTPGVRLRWCCLPCYTATLLTLCSRLSTVASLTQPVTTSRTSSSPSSSPPSHDPPSSPSPTLTQLLRLQWSNNHHKGTAFELLSVLLLSSLPTFPLTLHRRGGRSDLGVDFFGSHTTPHPPHLTHRIIGQCKMEQAIMGPHHLRALEGTVTQYTRRGRDAGAEEASGAAEGSTIGIIVGAQPYSREAEAQWRRSALPLILVTIDPVAALHIATAAAQHSAHTTDLAPLLLPCLRRFSLNPTASTLLPHTRIRPLPTPSTSPPTPP